ncbi:hypothetical protein CLERM_417 [Coxiella-like endosymbiont]|nr:hypothetical protein CLERM_417 [Coxiella-like endosymbiont]
MRTGFITNVKKMPLVLEKLKLLFKVAFINCEQAKIVK